MQSTCRDRELSINDYDVHYLFVSTEDDRYLVKGGIGTYLGIFVRWIEKHRPGVKVDWVTESPAENDFVDDRGQIQVHYLARYRNKKKSDQDGFANFLEAYVSKLVTKKLIDPKVRVIVEAPDWEGILANFFSHTCNSRILFVTRVHGPLQLCAVANQFSITGDKITQDEREQQQLKSSDLISCPTHFVYDFILKRNLVNEARKEFIRVLPNPINTLDFHPVSRATDDLKIGDTLIRTKNFNIAIVGSVEVRKGAYILAQAIENLCNISPDVHIYIAGHLKDRDDLTANIKLTRDQFLSLIPDSVHSRVHLLNYVPHQILKNLYARTDLGIVCYLADNFPGVVGEFGAAAIPFVTTQLGGIPEMISASNGRYLAMTCPGPVSDLASQIFQKVTEFYKDRNIGTRLANELHDRIHLHFTPEIALQSICDWYEQSLDDKSEVPTLKRSMHGKN